MPSLRHQSQTNPSSQPLSTSRLSFKPSSLTTKSLPTSDLTKRLKQLHLHLAHLDQDLVVQDATLASAAKEVMTTSLLLHKDKGVRAYLACCLVDVLRLYAPEAPYTQPQLKDLFLFLFRQLKHLGTVPTSSEPHFSEYFYVLESLSNVKSIVLICDLDAADELSVGLFRMAFDLISSNSPKNVLLLLSDLLSQIIDESPLLPPELIEILLSHFLPKSVAAKPAAHGLAMSVCQEGADKLQRYVCQYFGEVVTADATGREGGEGDGESDEESDEDEDDDDDDEDDDEPKSKKRKSSRTKVDQKKKKKSSKFSTSTTTLGSLDDDTLGLPSSILTAHSLIASLHASVPSLLLNVIPQLEEELGSPHPGFRLLATRVLETIQTLLVDTDDRVRLAACSIVDPEHHGIHVTSSGIVSSPAVLKALSERMRDKKVAVREVAFERLGRVWGLNVEDIENEDEHTIEHFGWIPGAMLECLEVPDASIRATVHATFLKHITPLPRKDDEDPAPWVDRVLVVLKHLQPGTQRDGFFSLTRLSEKRPGLLGQFIINCEKNNGGVIDQDADKVKQILKLTIKSMAATGRFADPAKVSEDLNKFAKANEKQLYKLLRTLLDPQTDLKLWLKSYRDTLRRLDAIPGHITDTFVLVIRAFAYTLVNRSSIPTLLKRSASSPEALLVLTKIAKLQPALFKVHVAELTRTLGEVNGEATVTVAAHALSRLIKSDASVSVDKKLAERVRQLANNGTPRQAKYAATVVALDSSRPGAADDLVESLADKLEDATELDLVSHLAALNRLARLANDAFETKSEQITEFALEVLNRSTVPGEVVDDDDIEWVIDDEQDPLTRARVLAVKVLTSRCVAYAATEDATKLAEPVFQLLWPLLHAHAEDSKYTRPVASRLRLTAAFSILKLAVASDKFQAEVFKRFEVLAYAVQDKCFEVRSAFITHLVGLLRERKLSGASRFNMILFLVAHDPEPEVRTMIGGYVRLSVSRLPPGQRQPLWEFPFVRLIHLLAHHPDFAGFTEEDYDAEEIVETVKIMARYIDLYIQNIVTEENIPYIFHLALKLKTVRDATSADYTSNLYRLSELSQHLLKQFAAAHSWPIPTHPDPAKMPSDIFRPLSADEGKALMKKTFLSPEVIEALSASSKEVKSKGKRARVKAEHREPKEPKVGSAVVRFWSSVHVLIFHTLILLAPNSPKLATAKPKRLSKKKKTGKWQSGSEDESAPESIDSGSESDEAPAPKKVRGAPRDRSGAADVASSPARRNGKSPARKARSPSEEPQSDLDVNEELVAKSDEEEEEVVVVAAKKSKSSKANGKVTAPPKKAAPFAAKKKATPAAPVEKKLTRGVVKGLGKPRKLELGNTDNFVSDLEGSDEEMQDD